MNQTASPLIIDCRIGVQPMSGKALRNVGIAYRWHMMTAALLAIGLAFVASLKHSEAEAKPVKKPGKEIFRFDTFGDEQL
jgi:hypothetical protein